MLFGLAAVAGMLLVLDAAAPLGMVLSGAAVGGSLSLYAVLPGRMEIARSNGAASLCRVVHHHLLDSGYVPTHESDSARRYAPIGSRWQRWEEKAITISVRDESTIGLEGPVLMLHGIRRMLARKRVITST